jgi:hypothetical protein
MFRFRLTFIPSLKLAYQSHYSNYVDNKCYKYLYGGIRDNDKLRNERICSDRIYNYFIKK